MGGLNCVSAEHTEWRTPATRTDSSGPLHAEKASLNFLKPYLYTSFSLRRINYFDLNCTLIQT